MSQVEVTINSRNYHITCDDGEEAHVINLSEYLDERVQDLVSSVGQVGHARLLVMIALMLADELSEASADLKTDAGAEQARISVDEIEARFADIVNDAAGRIEAITQGFFKAG